MEDVALAAEAKDGDWPVEFVVLTGGEPAVHDLRPLTHTLGRRLLQIHLETSGAFPLRGEFDWVTVSPKKWKLPIEETLQRADEFKLIIEEPGDIDFYMNLISDALHPATFPPVWLHPEWSKREDKTVLDAITKCVVSRGMPFRAGWQLHKLYKSDATDSRSAAPVPLGGNPEKGF
jgi:7-carboxy-7-deazaguanine synthase